METAKHWAQKDEEHLQTTASSTHAGLRGAQQTCTTDGCMSEQHEKRLERQEWAEVMEGPEQKAKNLILIV